MIKLFVSENMAELGMLREALEAEGIPCTVKNEAVYQLRPGIGSPYGYPELWILHDTDTDRALAVANSWRTPVAGELENWICPKCGEENEGQFGACWSCGAEAPA
jgi:hypothetical protein